MSDGDSPAPVLLLPRDVDWRDAPTAVPSWGGSDWPAIIAALLLHVVVIAILMVDWRWPVTPPPESIPVTIVFAPPPAPAAPPAPSPKPKPSPYDLESGKDQRTTAPPAAESASAEPVRPPDAAAPDEPKPPKPQAPSSGIPEKSTPAQQAAKPKTHDTVARLDPRKEADRLRPRHPAPDLLHIEPGDREQRGDPYLNRMVDLVEQKRIYPKVTSEYGLPVQGTAVYRVKLDRQGRLFGIELLTSSGIPELDAAGVAMIRAATPFPPLPAYIPTGAIDLSLDLYSK